MTDTRGDRRMGRFPPLVFTEGDEYGADYIQEFMEENWQSARGEHWTEMYPDDLQYYVEEVKDLLSHCERVQRATLKDNGDTPGVMESVSQDLRRSELRLSHLLRVMKARCLVLVTKGVSRTASPPPQRMDTVEAAREAVNYRKTVKNALRDADIQDLRDL